MGLGQNFCLSFPPHVCLHADTITLRERVPSSWHCLGGPETLFTSVYFTVPQTPLFPEVSALLRCPFVAAGEGGGLFKWSGEEIQGLSRRGAAPGALLASELF